MECVETGVGEVADLTLVSDDMATDAGIADVVAMLRGAGLRPTRQRVALAGLLFSEGDRHVSAETVFEEAITARVSVSLATVYNTLNQFTRAGLLQIGRASCRERVS
jgi:Fur family iron response transcriptional regulator